MRRTFRIVLLLPLAGCVSVAGLEHSSLRHESRARNLAEVGDGAGAAREANQAIADREEAHRRAEKRSSYWQSEVLLQ